MLRSLQRMEYFETYHFSNIIHNILSDPFEWLQNLHEWHENQGPWLFSEPFSRTSILHDFIAYIIESLMYEELGDVVEDSIVHRPDFELWVDRALKHHGFETEGIRNWMKSEGVPLDQINEDTLHDYHSYQYQSGQLEDLITQLSSEVFHVVFANRSLLSNFNLYVSSAVEQLQVRECSPEASSRFSKNGVLKRVRIPEWVKRAVYHRDRGRCAMCKVDISGLVSIEMNKHFDHIIPLARSGVNDITNIQLLCETCNVRKGARSIHVSNTYESWY